MTEQNTKVFGHTEKSILEAMGIKWPQDGVTAYDDGQVSIIEKLSFSMMKCPEVEAIYNKRTADSSKVVAILYGALTEACIL